MFGAKSEPLGGRLSEYSRNFGGPQGPIMGEVKTAALSLCQSTQEECRLATYTLLQETPTAQYTELSCLHIYCSFLSPWPTRLWE